MNIAVNCRGFIGDVLFAGSIAKKLKEKYPGCYVLYIIPVIQPKLLLEQNPYIDQVAYAPHAGQFPVIDMWVQVPEVDQRYPATIQFQAAAGIEDQSLEYDVYTVPEYDKYWDREMSRIFTDNYGMPVIAYQKNWEEKSFLFTPEEYERAVDTPPLGYGGKRRDIDKIIDIIDPYCYAIPVGFDNGVGQNDPKAADPELYARTASLIKHCDYFIGSEGGLSNLAAAVGTKCIITTDFIWQLYGPKGCIRRIDNPAMGPATYYPDAGHIHLNPFYTDEEVGEAILRVFDGYDDPGLYSLVQQDRQAE